MKIAIDIRLIGKGRTGDETVFSNLTRELLRIDNESEYLLLTDQNDGKSLSEIRRILDLDGARRARLLSFPGRGRFFWNLFSAPLFLFREKPDIFHTQYILPWFIPRSTKVVTHIHDVSFRAFPELISWKDRFFLWLLIPRTMRRSDLLIAPSGFTKDEIIAWYGVPSEKIAVVPNALSPDFLTEVSQDQLLSVRKKYHLPEKFLLSVGTLQPRKNLPLLIRAFAEVRKRVPGYSLVLVGNRSAHHFDYGIDQAIREAGLESAVIFPGFVDQADLPAFYRLAVGLVFPSRYEGFGIPILEGFASSVPVVVSDIPPFREVGGEAVLLFSSNGVAECAETLYTLLAEEGIRSRLVEVGKNRLLGFSWHESARVMLKAYETLSGKHGSAVNS